MLVVGAVLYASGATVHHFSPTALPFWPWPIGPLSAQVTGAWLIALAIAAGLSIRERDLDRLFVPTATYTAFGGFQLLATLHNWPAVRPDNQSDLGLRRGACPDDSDRCLRDVDSCRGIPVAPFEAASAAAD